MNLRQEKWVPAAKHALHSICRAAADPLRINILRVLSKDSFGVQELARILSVPQPGMSHHLKILSSCGLLVTRREGNSIFYRRALLKGEGELDAFQRTLYETIDSAPIDNAHTLRMGAIYRDRSSQSRLYFERNAGRFAENQEILCNITQYFANLTELLELTHLPKTSRVMEVGPGEGVLLEELQKRFDKLVALDDSSEMLELAKRKLSSKKRNVEFVKCSLEAFTPKGPSFDAVALNMVLHHMSSPAQALRKLSQIVADGGYVLIADLCSHDQQWTKESCGDVWLGFDPQDLHDWAKDAGLEEMQSSYLSLKNGFQIQLKLFRKRNHKERSQWQTKTTK